MLHSGQSDTATAIRTACIWEATARKVGNVHRGADFLGTTYLDFVLSAGEVAEPLTNGNGIGLSILNAVRATARVAKSNTNLGIILLLAPLATEFLDRTLDCLSHEDARHAFEAIRLAHPGGLGNANEQDVRSEPSVTLLEAMRLAADRDLIARQYANGFADILDFGVPAFLDAWQRFGTIEAAIVDLQLRWLAEHPDSLIVRKCGLAVAEGIQSRASEVLKRGGLATPEGRRAGVALDRHLRSEGNTLNPGTTADLIAACLFVALRETKVKPTDPFCWPTDEWF